MRLHLSTDPRQKHGLDVLTFTHNLHKSKKHITGCIIEKPYNLASGKDLLYQFSVYIRQKDTVVAFANGIAFDFETFFHKDYQKELGKRCKYFGDIYETEFLVVAEHLSKTFGLDKDKFEEIKRKKPAFGLDNGFIFIESLFVHPFYRKKGYATALLKAIKKKYDAGLCFAVSEQPFKVDDLSILNIKDRKIDIGTLRTIPQRFKSERICEKNLDFISHSFCMNSAMVELFTNYDYGTFGYYCILNNFVASYL